MPGASLGVGGSRQRLQYALVTAALAILVVVAAATWSNYLNPAMSSSTFEQPVTVEAVIVDEGRRNQGGSTVCSPTYQFELEGRNLEVATQVALPSACAAEGDTRRVTVDAADPTRVIDPAVERDRSVSLALGTGVSLVMLSAAAIIRWSARRAGGGGVGPRRSGRRGRSSGSIRRPLA